MRHQDVKRESVRERPRASTEAYVASFQEKFLVYSIAARTKTDTGGQARGS